jgi:hypothetical protein
MLLLLQSFFRTDVIVIVIVVVVFPFVVVVAVVFLRVLVRVLLRSVENLSTRVPHTRSTSYSTYSRSTCFEKNVAVLLRSKVWWDT